MLVIGQREALQKLRAPGAVEVIVAAAELESLELLIRRYYQVTSSGFGNIETQRAKGDPRRLQGS